MTTIAEELAMLRALRASGVLSVRTADGRAITYRSDAELVAAIQDLERRLEAETRRGPAGRIRYVQRRSGW